MLPSQFAGNTASVRSLLASIVRRLTIKLSIHTHGYMWHSRISFKDSADNRRIRLLRFINFYSTVKPHKGLNNATPYEILTAFLINSL
ncbi:MAG: transposase [Nitrosomonas sp.]|nr:transposase [Nitrosomonas sp.]